MIGRNVKEVINENANIWTVTGIITIAVGAGMAVVSALVAFITGGFDTMEDLI